MDKLPKAVTDYIELWYDGQIKLNKERKQLIEHLNRYVFNRDDIYFDEKKINEIITFTENFYFKLESFQKFIIAFIFLKYKEDDALFYE
ncbi:phage terminase large subunit-like protein [Staphylococcus auricularis]